MESLVEKGLVKAIGVSNFNEDQLRVLQRDCKVSTKKVALKGLGSHSPLQIKPTVNQIECHPYLNQQRLIDFCRNNSIHVTAYSPLGCKDRVWGSPTDDVPLLEHPALVKLSQKHGKSPAQVILKWQVSANKNIL